MRPTPALLVFPSVDRFASAAAHVVQLLRDEPAPRFAAGYSRPSRCHNFFDWASGPAATGFVAMGAGAALPLGRRKE